jgi:hypothetical protein
MRQMLLTADGFNDCSQTAQSLNLHAPRVETKFERRGKTLGHSIEEFIFTKQS